MNYTYIVYKTYIIDQELFLPQRERQPLFELNNRVTHNKW